MIKVKILVKLRIHLMIFTTNTNIFYCFVAPVMLSSGVQGDVYLFDDTNLYQPVWRQVCEVSW